MAISEDWKRQQIRKNKITEILESFLSTIVRVS
jgi:hypothetical protein